MMMHFPKETAFFFSWNDIKTSVMTEHITEQKHPLNLSLVQILSSDWNREKKAVTLPGETLPFSIRNNFRV